MTYLTTGALAKQAAVNIATIRYYERTGLLAEPARSAAGYRQYPATDVQRVKFIKRAQRLGFTLNEIRDLLALQFDAPATCDDVIGAVEAKIAEIDEKLAGLLAMRESLSTLAVRCQADCDNTCGVLLDEQLLVAHHAEPTD